MFGETATKPTTGDAPEMNDGAELHAFFANVVALRFDFSATTCQPCAGIDQPGWHVALENGPGGDALHAEHKDFWHALSVLRFKLRRYVG